MQFLNIVIQHFITTKGGSGALGIQQPYPYPPNDKMKTTTTFFFTYDHSLLPTMRKTIHETTPKPTILLHRLQQGSKTIKKSSILQPMVHQEQNVLLGS